MFDLGYHAKQVDAIFKRVFVYVLFSIVIPNAMPCIDPGPRGKRK